MSTEKPTILFHLEDETKRKLKILAKEDGRSMSNYIEMLIKQAIKQYETNNNINL